MSFFENVPMPPNTNAFSQNSPLDDDTLLEMMIQQLINNPSQLAPTLEKFPPKKKSEQTVTTEYLRGKTAWGQNNHEEAVTGFTKALIAAPKSSKKIVTCYIARSMCLQKLKAYRESIEDINRALMLSPIKEQEDKLLTRKKEMETLLSTQAFKNQKINENAEESFELSYGENKEIIGVSAALNLAYNEKFGRHYIAARDIKLGDLLMNLKPYVHAPLAAEIAQGRLIQNCDHCLKFAQNPIPCDNCVIPVYCSEACKLEAYNKIHKTECEVAQRMNLTNQIIALRALLKGTVNGEKLDEHYQLMEKIDNCKDRRTCGFSSNGKLDGTKPEAILSLLVHSDKVKLSELVIGSACIIHYLKQNTPFFNGRDNYENIKKAAKLLVKLSYICTMNMHGIKNSGVNDKVASAMYPVFNYLNNGCANNTFWYDRRDNKILRAGRDIEKGEQVCIAYLHSEVHNTTCAERNNFFRTVKFFTCHCEACKNNYEFKLELNGRLKLPNQLEERLLHKPNDTKSLWELLRLIRKVHKGPSIEAKEIEIALADAHMGDKNEMFLYTLMYLNLLKRR